MVACCFRFHYGGDAVLRDAEQTEIILQLLKGLRSYTSCYVINVIIFEMSVDIVIADRLCTR